MCCNLLLAVFPLIVNDGYKNQNVETITKIVCAGWLTLTLQCKLEVFSFQTFWRRRPRHGGAGNTLVVTKQFGFDICCQQKSVSPKGHFFQTCWRRRPRHGGAENTLVFQKWCSNIGVKQIFQTFCSNMFSNICFKKQNDCSEILPAQRLLRYSCVRSMCSKRCFQRI